MKENISRLAVIVALTLAIVGGIFFGLFSCGGYLWHTQLFSIIFGGFILIILLVPPKALIKFWKRILFIFLISITFFLIRAGASAFYPTTPESLSEFFKSFIGGILNGPC